MSPSICKCSSPSGNLVSCSLLTFFFYSFSCLSYGRVICDTFEVYLVAYTNAGTTYGATFPLIILCACASMFSYSFLALNLGAPPSLALFFLLRTLLGNFATTFLLFTSVVCIFSLVFLTLAYGFCGFSFW